jgi:hypothetical protein
VIRARLDAVETFMNFVYLWSEDDSSQAVIEEVPNGVAAAINGVLGVTVATDTSPLRVSVELHDQQPPPMELAAGEDVAVLTWRPCGIRLRLADTVGHEVEGLTLGPGDEVLAVEVRCRGRDEAAGAGAGELKKPVEEILILLWPGPAPEEKLIRQSSFGRMLAGEPPPPSGPAAPLALGETAVIPVSYHGFYLRDEEVPVTWQSAEPTELSSALVNGLVSNLPGLARLKAGTRAGEVDLRVRVVGRQAATVADALAMVGGAGLPAAADAVAVTHQTSGRVLVTDIENRADHYRLEVPAGEVGLLVIAWDRDKAARQRRNAKTRELIDLVYWTGETPGEQIIQAASKFGQEMADTDESIRLLLDLK